MNRGRGPIVVVCYTNHALDQFLEGIVDLFDKKHQREHRQDQLRRLGVRDFQHPPFLAPIVRLGGRCKSEKLQPYELFNVRRSARFRPHKEIYELRLEGETLVNRLSQEVSQFTAQWKELGEINGNLWSISSTKFYYQSLLHSESYFEIFCFILNDCMCTTKFTMSTLFLLLL